LYNELGPRIYEILKPNQQPKPLPRDADEWLQCNKPNRGCGRIYARYQSKIEAGIGDMIASESNPHDTGQSVVGLDNKRYKKTEIEKQRERQLKERKKAIREYNQKEVIEKLDPDTEIEEARRNLEAAEKRLTELERKKRDPEVN